MASVVGTLVGTAVSILSWTQGIGAVHFFESVPVNASIRLGPAVLFVGDVNGE